MSKFVVVIFPDETKAYEGLRSLKDLHGEGSLTLYSNAVIQRSAEGWLSVKEKQTEAPLGAGVTALVGALVGLLAGPVGMVVGAGAGAALGSVRDLLNLGISNEFLDTIIKELSPGKTAVVAEISEEWVTPLDSRMEPIGGVVVREWRDDFVEDEIQRRVSRRKAELAQRKAELAATRAELVEAMKRRVSEAEQALRATADHATARMERDREQAEAKIIALQNQATRARSDAKAWIEKRIAEIRADQNQRLGKLEQAWKLTQEALRPGGHSTGGPMDRLRVFDP